MFFTRLFFVFLIVISVFSCKSENKENLSLTTTCDTSKARLSIEVKSILSKNCYGCHNAKDANAFGDGVDLETYEKLKTVALTGDLLGSIKHTAGVASMPPSGTKLADCDIKLIEKWITDGAKND